MRVHVFGKSVIWRNYALTQKNGPDIITSYVARYWYVDDGFLSHVLQKRKLLILWRSPLIVRKLCQRLMTMVLLRFWKKKTGQLFNVKHVVDKPTLNNCAIVFKCLVTRAYHIELIEEISSLDLENAVRRFAALRRHFMISKLTVERTLLLQSTI